MIFTVLTESSPVIVEYVLIGIAFMLGIVIPTVVSLFTKRGFDKFFAKKERSEKEQKEMSDKVKTFEDARERNERKKDMREAIEESITPIKQDLLIIKKGTQAGLRHDLCTLADEWLSKGYCPRKVKEDFENLYTLYHLLGKNGVMDNTYQAILDLSETPLKTTKKTTQTKQSKKIIVSNANDDDTK